MSRSANAATGERGEERAAHYLLGQGCTIVERNWHANPGEIDIVARCRSSSEGDVLAFVEVRTRHGRTGLAEESISPKKAASMVAAAYSYMEANKIDPEQVSWRIDLISIALEGNTTTVNWIKSAIADVT